MTTIVKSRRMSTEKKQDVQGRTEEAGIETPEMWSCVKYGVLMFAAQADAFCARRYSAAHREAASRISFSLCRNCDRGALAHRGAVKTASGGRDRHGERQVT